MLIKQRVEGLGEFKPQHSVVKRAMKSCDNLKVFLKSIILVFQYYVHR